MIMVKLGDGYIVSVYFYIVFIEIRTDTFKKLQIARIHPFSNL